MRGGGCTYFQWVALLGYVVNMMCRSAAFTCDYPACLTRPRLEPQTADLTSCARSLKRPSVGFLFFPLVFVNRLHVYQTLGKSAFVILHPRHKAVGRRSAVTRQQALQPIRWLKCISHVSTALDLYTVSCSHHVNSAYLKNSLHALDGNRLKPHARYSTKATSTATHLQGLAGGSVPNFSRRVYYIGHKNYHDGSTVMSLDYGLIPKHSSHSLTRAHPSLITHRSHHLRSMVDVSQSTHRDHYGGFINTGSSSNASPEWQDHCGRVPNLNANTSDTRWAYPKPHPVHYTGHKTPHLKQKGRVPNHTSQSLYRAQPSGLIYTIWAPSTPFLLS